MQGHWQSLCVGRKSCMFNRVVETFSHPFYSGKMLDTCRAAIVDLCDEKQERTELYVEAFEW